MPLVDELNDNCFAVATHMLVELCKEIEEEAGTPPTYADLCDVLTWAARGVDRIADRDTAELTAIIPKLRKRKAVKLEAGDVIAIPTASREWFFAVYILRENRFGWAFGVLDIVSPTVKLAVDRDIKAWRIPIYTGPKSLESGRWQKCGHAPELLQLFPEAPEIFHSREDNLDDDEIGPYGCGEKPDGTIRNLTKKQAEELGLLDGTYSQSLSEKLFEAYLNEHLLPAHRK